MYAARPKILALTGHTKLDDRYFTQMLLPGYLDDLEESAEWYVAYDARGTFTEPHTAREIALGTIEVREYLAEHPSIGPPVSLAWSKLFPTSGPKNRYSNVLYIEKEG